MKRIIVAILICLTLLGSIVFIEFNLYKLSIYKNKEKAEDLLKLAYKTIDENKEEKFEKIMSNNQQEIDEVRIESQDKLEEKRKVQNENGIIGILIIEKLNINAPIKEGTSQDIMRTAVGHFIESDYWSGNVSFASHNSGTNAHYFENINLLKINDEITYITKLGTKKYKVQSINTIKDTDWTMVMKNTENTQKTGNTITLITCITGKPEYRLCVRGIEI